MKSNSNQLTARDSRHKTLVLLCLLVALVYSSFSGLTMMAMHDTGLPDTAMSEHLMHSSDHALMDEMNQDHCGGNDDACGSDHSMDCSASHCNPVGSLPVTLKAIKSQDFSYLAYNALYQSVNNHPPVTPPRTLHV